MTIVKYWAKAGVQLLGAVLIAILPILSTGTNLNTAEWVNVATIGVGAAVVWNTTNHPEWPYGKVIGSALMTALTTLNSFSTGGITREEIMQIVLALVTTLTVGGIPNVVPTPSITTSNMNPEGTSIS